MISVTERGSPEALTASVAEWPGIALAGRWSGFEDPSCMAQGDGTVYVAERCGRVLAIEHGRVREEPFLDLRACVRSRGGRGGLLDMCVRSAPGNGTVALQVLYTPFRDTYRLSEFAVAGGRAGPERMVVEAADSAGASIAAPGGELWLALGRGRGGGSRPFGSLLRGRGAQEVWEVVSTEPRVPRGLAFDRLTGDVYLADHGEDGVERVLAGSADGVLVTAAAYAHPQGAGVVGGAVYRGRRHPSLRGVYLHADETTGEIWGMRRDPEAGGWERRLLAKTGSVPAGLWEDEQGEVYAATREGTVYEVTALEPQP